MIKRFLLPALLAVLLFAAGCTQGDDTISGTSASSETPSVGVLSESASSAEPVSTQESSAEEISLIPVGVYELSQGILFHLPTDWTAEESSSETELLNASSPDGLCMVSAYLTALPNPVGMTEAILVGDAVATLPDGLAASGAEIVSLEAVPLSFLETEHLSVSLVTVKDGQTVCQQQLYLIEGDKVLLLTVTSRTKDVREELWSYFDLTA